MDEHDVPETQICADDKLCCDLRKARLLPFTIAAAFVVDQITKFLVKSNILIGESWPVERLAQITHKAITGFILGLLSDQTFINVSVSLIAFGVLVGFLLYLYRACALSKPILRFAVGL